MQEEKELLEAAIMKIKNIADDVRDENLWLDEEAIFYCLFELYNDHEGYLPSIVELYE